MEMLLPNRHRFDFCRRNRQKSQGFAQAVFQRGVQRAIYQKDIGSRLIRDLRTQMLRSIDTSSLSAADKHTYRSHATTAPIEQFRAKVWQLELKSIARQRGKSLQSIQ